ncbi:hypothetical protein [Desulfoluna spongiiphila]|uniref:hypothetical protein n=1 Tax=Desulfoluna spongiiphila TaxID=419481 RepID=UPI001259CBD2|nr:hypothetical protein [Desulfoluna spongiiphila]VVS95333.1 consensus disorder prediction [Desulfoluna spongiiphila]
MDSVTCICGRDITPQLNIGDTPVDGVRVIEKAVCLPTEPNRHIANVTCSCGMVHEIRGFASLIITADHIVDQRRPPTTKPKGGDLNHDLSSHYEPYDP